MTKITYILFLILSLFAASAQETTAVSTVAKEPEMADLFRSEGKIYVVIAVLGITFLCLAAYLIYIDLKLKKLENKK